MKKQSDRGDSSGTTTRIRRIYIWGVPIDVVPQEQFRATLLALLTEKKPSQIVFVEWWDVIRAIFNFEYRAVLRHAALVVPVAPSVVHSARILRKKGLTRYHPFDFTVKLLALLESHNNSIYLIGADLNVLQVAESNIRETYPQLRIVGRHPGFFSAVQEKSVVVAIRKSAPTLLLAGGGLQGRDAWLHKIRHHITTSITAFSRITFNILANRSRRTSAAIIRAGLECIPKFLKSPWRIYRFPIFLIYFFLLICRRVLRIY